MSSDILEHIPQQYLTPQQLADLLQVPLQSIYRWNHLGTGPRYVAVGRHVRFPRAAVAEWLEQRGTPRPAA